MADFSIELLGALGMVVINAADLEAALGAIAAERLGLNAMDALGRPGAALRGARRATEEMGEDARAAFTTAIDRADELLRSRHRLIHAMWIVRADGEKLPDPLLIHMRTFEQTTVTAEQVDSLARDLKACRDRLIGMLAALRNQRPLDANCD
jgi:hypothetical protein